MWFRKLSPKMKLMWWFTWSHCDSVGVWEEDYELASFIIGETVTKEEVREEFKSRIKEMNEKKIWIIGFCKFQYGTLEEKNTNNKPHQSYIRQLKKHSLWKDYTKSMDSPSKVGGGFRKPTVEEIEEYMREENIAYPKDNAKRFWDSNEAKGWVVGRNKTPMKDWKAAIRTWKLPKRRLSDEL